LAVNEQAGYRRKVNGLVARRCQVCKWKANHLFAAKDTEQVSKTTQTARTYNDEQRNSTGVLLEKA